MGPDLEALSVDPDEASTPGRGRPGRSRGRLVPLLLASLLLAVTVAAVQLDRRLRTTRAEPGAARAAAAGDDRGVVPPSHEVATSRALDACTFPLTPRFVPPGWSREFRSGDGGESGDPAALGYWGGGRGRYVNILRPDNGWLPVPVRPAPAGAESVTVLGAAAYLQPIHDGYGVGVELAGDPPCGFAVAGYGISSDDLRTLVESLDASPTGPDRSDQPSQTASEAERDGVLAELAAAAVVDRSEWSAVVKSPEGTWVLSRPARALQETASGCVLGDRNGSYGIDFICTSEYGEILLFAPDGAILRAYPMPGVPPKWIHVAPHAIYSGAIGDGALPSSTLVRIDRSTLKADVIVFPHPTEGSSGRYLPRWRRATASETTAYHRLVEVGEPDAALTDVASAIGPVGVDIQGVERLFRP